MKHNQLTIAITHESEVMMASMSAIRMAEKAGMSAVECTMCATAVSELATNIMRYADEGKILLHFEKDTFHITAKDHGPGIADVDLAMQEGHSGGTGLGMGLPGVARMMDNMNIETSVGMGTCVTVSKIKHHQIKAAPLITKPNLKLKGTKATVKRLDDALLVRPAPGEQVSGDGILSIDIPSYHFMALWDVSGHGDNAHKLSEKVERFIRQHCEKEPHTLLREVHEKFRGTRGLVAVIARLSPTSGWLEYAGVGNVSLLHVHAHGMRRLALQEGIIGYQIRTPKSERLQLHKGDTLIMHSDGIQTIREALQVYRYTTANELLKTIFKNHTARQADDASCLVLRYRV